MPKLRNNSRVIVIDTNGGNNEIGCRTTIFNQRNFQQTVFLINAENSHFGYGFLKVNHYISELAFVPNQNKYATIKFLRKPLDP